MEHHTEHKWKRRQRCERRIKIILLSTAAACVILGTTMALSAGRPEEKQAESTAAAVTPRKTAKNKKNIQDTVDTSAASKVSDPVDKPKKWDDGLTGWVQEDSAWYYLNSDGSMATGWIQADGIWYYMNKDGVMCIGWIQPEGTTWYYLNENGAMQTGWIQLAEGWYYLQDDGAMATGWICDKSGHNYFLQENGQWIADAIPTSGKTNGNYEGPLAALTFDDGPDAYTSRLLDTLEKYKARATFFMLGQQVEKYPEEVRRMDTLGCEIGNHSYDHADLTGLDNSGVQIQFGQTNETLIQTIGRGASVARPPYASMNQSVLDNIGMPSIIWNIDTLDWQTMNAQATIDTVLNQVTDGDIILMHDIHQTSVQAAEALIPALIDRGYTLVTISELANIKGVPLQPGNTYGSFK